LTVISENSKSMKPEIIWEIYPTTLKIAQRLKLQLPPTDY